MSSSAIRDLLRHSKIPGMISLAGGIPAPDLIDTEGLEAATFRAVESARNATYQYGLTEGELFLREEIASRMVAQGISAEPDHILARISHRSPASLADCAGYRHYRSLAAVTDQ